VERNRFQRPGSLVAPGTKQPRWLPAEAETRQPLRKVVDVTRLPPPGSKPGFVRTGPASANISARPTTAGTKLVTAQASGFLLALFGFYIFMHTGAFGEITAVFLHLALPMVAAMCVVISLTAIVHGGMDRFFTTPISRPWPILYIWMCLSSIFSFYITASVGFIVPFGLRFMVMPVLFCAFLTTPNAVRGALNWAAFGLVPILILCVTKGQMLDGIRFAIPDTTLENPNDLAFHLLWGSCLLLSFFFRPGKLGKIFTIITIPPCIWFVMKTASRANFVAIFVLMGVVFIMVPGKIRMIIGTIMPVILVATVIALPKATQDRILAIVVGSAEDVAVQVQSNGGSDDNVKSAMESQAERMELSKLAIDATLRHPIFGVGPLMFADETANYIMAKTGKKAPWLTAHDSYLKISSETGIPGTILYIWSVLAGLAMNYSVYKRTSGKPERIVTNRNAMCIFLALATYAFSTFFADLVYYAYLPITLGFTAANYLVAKTEDRQLEEERLNAAVPA
jgi:hypothetical protein